MTVCWDTLLSTILGFECLSWEEGQVFQKVEILLVVGIVALIVGYFWYSKKKKKKK
ncbi:LPXTG cell wall anchor domain-containing protein [Candidatus Woesearchaeota archaeon]|nr:LPXTG cell wall anchor domain-containing protein [Candidatus Woesearchaeota archaeon]